MAVNIALAIGQNEIDVEELSQLLRSCADVVRNPELVADYKAIWRKVQRLSVHQNAQLRGVQRSIVEQIAILEKRYPTTLANARRRSFLTLNFGAQLDVNTGQFIKKQLEVRPGGSDLDLGRKGRWSQHLPNIQSRTVR
jgi:hypothetical protein